MQEYRDIRTESSVMREDTEQLGYINFSGALFTYSKDGASLSNYDGAAIWNESFDMENPACDVCAGYIVLYDKESTKIYIFSPHGLETSLDMPKPVARAVVSAVGSVAVLMQEHGAAQLSLFDIAGNEIAGGQLHMTNTGYPLSLDISYDGTRLLVSLLDLNVGDVKTTLNFYDFTDAGSGKENNITSRFSYADMAIPEVHFFDTGEAVAYGDNEIILYKVGIKADVKSEIFLNDSIKSVLTEDSSFAIITSKSYNNGEEQNTLIYYNLNGTEIYKKTVPRAYTEARFLEGKEILLSDRENINIYTRLGIHKFSYSSQQPILEVMPAPGFKTYYFIKKKITEKVKLK